MGHALTKNSSGAFVNEGNSKKNYIGYVNPPLRTAAGQNRFMFLFFNNPLPLSANGVTAFLRLYNATAWAGSNTISIRMVTGKWAASKVTYSNRPGVGAVTETLTKTGGQAAGTLWEFPLNAEMQTAADGQFWWGFRIEVSASTDRRIGGPTSSDSLRPQLEVTWEDAPEAPDELYPSGGRIVAGARPQLKGNFVDTFGDTTMSSYEVKGNLSADFDPNLGTGYSYAPAITDSTDPTHTMLVDLPPDTDFWWAMRVKDGAGIWSEWSRTEVFQRHDHSALVINNPATGTPAFVEDPSPEIAWTFSGTQKHYAVIIRNLTQQTEQTTGKITSTANAVTLKDPLSGTGDAYEVEVRVWDNLNREANIVEAYQSARRAFFYTPSSATSPVTSLNAARAAFGPGADISFNRADFPDKYSLVRDNLVVQDNIDPADIFVSGTSSVIHDFTASARKSHTWKVIPVVGTGAPSVNPTITKTFRSNAAWLCQRGGANPIALFRVDASGLVKGSTGATKQVIGSGENIVISVNRGGWSGPVTARIMGFGGYTSDELVDRLEKIRLDPDPRVYFAWKNQAIIATIDSINWLPVSKTEEVLYDVTFNINQRSKM